MPAPVQAAGAPPPQVQMQVPVTRAVVFPWGHSGDPPAAPQRSPLPPYFRSTTAAFPTTREVETSAGVPLGVVINPGQVVDTPLIDYSQVDRLARCFRCAAYLSPYSKIMGDGRSWQCPFCSQVNQIQDVRLDSSFAQKVELTAPVYDMVAPKSFVGPQRRCPCFMFLIDLSLEAVSSGFTLQCLNSIQNSLDAMNENVKVGLMTMGKRVTVYDFRQERALVVNDVSDPCVPGMCVAELKECKEKLKKVLEGLIAKSGEAESNGHCYGSALGVAEKALGGCGGVLIACCAAAPSVGPHTGVQQDPNAPEAKKLQGAEDPVATYYRDLGFALNRAGISVHLFNIPTASRPTSDIPKMGIPCGLTGGVVHFYKEFDPLALHTDLFETMTANYLWDASLRLRCTTGVKSSAVFANCTLREGTLYFPILGANCGITYELHIEQEIKTPTILFQCAILWRGIDMKRYIRVFTFEVPTTNQPQQIKELIDERAMATWYLKKAAFLALGQGAVEATSAVRKMFATTAARTSFQSLYHFIHSLLCSPLLRPNITSLDVRYSTILKVRSFSLQDSLLYLYPRMFAVDGPETPIPLASESFGHGNIILVHTQDKLFLWISPGAQPDQLQKYFGCQSFESLPTEVPQLQTPENQHLNALITDCYTLSRRYLLLEIIPPGSPRESIFAELLVDMSQISGSDMSSFVLEFGVH